MSGTENEERAGYSCSGRDTVLTAVDQFRAAANAAATAWANRPPYIAYRVDVDVDVPAIGRKQRISRAVESRTRDDEAVIQDLPTGQNQLGPSFPITPAFDAISYFHLTFRLGDPLRGKNPISGVVVDRPITFDAPQASSEDVAVVASTLRNYYPEYAPDSTDAVAHILMQPLPALTRNNPSTFYLHDVYVDTATNLPTRVTYRGVEADFDLDYERNEHGWLVDHVYYRRTLFGPFHLGRLSFTVNATYSQFAFPAEPNDARLRS